jgi:hypothetical protein
MLIWKFGEDTVSIKTEDRWASVNDKRWRARDMDDDDDDDRPCESPTVSLLFHYDSMHS